MPESIKILLNAVGGYFGPLGEALAALFMILAIAALAGGVLALAWEFVDVLEGFLTVVIEKGWPWPF